MTWYVRGRDVLDRVEQHPDEAVRREFYRLLADLAEDPRDEARQRRLGVMPLKGVDERRRSFSVPFDDAILAYVLTLDQPVILLIDIVWL